MKKTAKCQLSELTDPLFELTVIRFCITNGIFNHLSLFYQLKVKIFLLQFDVTSVRFSGLILFRISVKRQLEIFFASSDWH